MYTSSTVEIDLGFIFLVKQIKCSYILLRSIIRVENC